MAVGDDRIVISPMDGEEHARYRRKWCLRRKGNFVRFRFSPRNVMDAAKKAFVMMPFDPSYDECFRDIFRPALEGLGYRVNRADDFFRPQPIMDHVREEIRQADLLLADMSGKNPNVFYELGLAHAAGKPVLLVSRKEEDIPFDLRHVGSILYESGRRAWKHKLRARIQEATKELEALLEPWPPPLAAPRPKPRFGIRILSPSTGDEVEMGSIVVSGSYEVRPPHQPFLLFVSSPAGNECWPQDPVRFNDDNTWVGAVKLYVERQATIMVAEVGEAGVVLVEYYRRAGEVTQSWVPLRQLTSDIVIHERVRIRTRSG